ncbi:MAG: glutathione S-transferase N-terminal domain-containing protein [Rhodospirillales bacterium]|nr:glutathione S-transferase N-terminal domain-containing protein [Rhodospirillales bacterium]
MLLRYLATSPYVRKVMVCAMEAGLESRIEKVPTSPQSDEQSLAEQNPLSKVPTLMLDDGTALYDSTLICEYLDSLHDGPKLFPETGPARWSARLRHSLGHGIIDASVQCRYEGMRPEDLQWDEWAAKQKRKIARALDVIEHEAETDLLPAADGDLTIGEIAIGCALGYLDLRFAADDWRHNRPALSSWYEDLSGRPSMQATAPKAT